MTIGERLRQLRNGLKMTLLDVGEKTQLSVSHLSDIERGRTRPSLDTLEVLAACYGISLADLMAGVSPTAVSCDNYPAGLAALVEHAEVIPEWADTLSRVEFRGKRPTSTDEWRMLYLYLKTMLDRETPGRG